MPRSAVRSTVLLLALTLIVAACGGRLSDDEVLAASGVEAGAVGGGAVAGAGVSGGAGPTGDASTGSTIGGGGGGAGTGPATGPTPAGEGGAAAGSADAPGGLEEGGAAEAPADGPSTPGETGPIVIGSVGNYSGPAGAAQVGIPRGVQTWAAAVNSRGGLFGRKVEVIVVDDGGDPARYGSAIRDLVENRGAVAFVGNGASLSMRGGDAYLKQRGIPVIGSDCSVPEWFTSPVYFPQCPRFQEAIGAIMAAPHQITGKTRFGFLVCTEAVACTSQKPLILRSAQAAGVNIVYSADVSLTQVDFTAECRNAQAAKVEIFYVGADPNTLSRVARSCERQGFAPQYSQASISVTHDVYRLPGLDDIIVAGGVFPFDGGSGAAFDEYRRAYDALVGEPPGPADAMGWAAGKLFEKVATDAARTSQSISTETLLAAARQISGETLGGLTTELDFTSGQARPRNCYFAVQAVEGRWRDAFGGPKCA